MTKIELKKEGGKKKEENKQKKADGRYYQQNNNAVTADESQAPNQKIQQHFNPHLKCQIQVQAHNVMEYMKILSIGGKIKYTIISPSIFKIGDLVEASFAVVGISIKDQQVKLILSLKGLTLLDQMGRTLYTSNHEIEDIRLKISKFKVSDKNHK
ncbi:hypothetical protein BDQ12DRAFT_664608 [Crucibulum laeve]|uniref:Uncharacterized protein n=1 Tax=Crucibulum laeve TaxID=68775 RepID=A0A5C3M4B4_9AGAR|nr:hypothetical protein BDQ12DRAFT_664608 [Crucibulum laeve]